jgi:hypothetical protein
MTIGNNEVLLWIVMEDGIVLSGKQYFECYCTPQRVRLEGEDQEGENQVVKKEDPVKDMFYSS